MEEILMEIATSILKSAMSNNPGNTNSINPSTNSGRSISNLMKGAV